LAKFQTFRHLTPGQFFKANSDTGVEVYRRQSSGLPVQPVQRTRQSMP